MRADLFRRLERHDPRPAERPQVGQHVAERDAEALEEFTDLGIGPVLDGVGLRAGAHPRHQQGRRRVEHHDAIEQVGPGLEHLAPPGHQAGPDAIGIEDFHPAQCEHRSFIEHEARAGRDAPALHHLAQRLHADQLCQLAPGRGTRIPAQGQELREQSQAIPSQRAPGQPPQRQGAPGLGVPVELLGERALTGGRGTDQLDDQPMCGGSRRLEHARVRPGTR